MSFTVIPTHKLGLWLIAFIDSILDKLGLEHEKTVETIIYIVMIVAVAIFIGWLTRRLILFLTQKMVALYHTDIGDELLSQQVFTKCSHIIPPLVLLGLVPLAFETDTKTLGAIENIVIIYFLITLGIGINAVLTFLWVHFDTHDNENKHPLRGLLNTGHGIVWLIIALISLSVLLGKSPTTVMAGLGVFATALMLIFKDPILGFVAGIQLSQNDMLRVGDWIAVTSAGANGIVEDVSLTVVKVRNWDNTLIMLPPYTLVSTSFQNWRGMFESGTRQIARAVYLDNASIVSLDSDAVDNIVAKVPSLKDFVDRLRAKGIEYSSEIAPVNGSIETNLGLFRAYLGQYLHNHPEISTEKFMMVRLQASGSFGTPLQIFCYCKLTKWTGYEAVQSEIFEHIAAMAPVFGLTIFNNPDRNSFTVNDGKLPETGQSK